MGDPQPVPLHRTERPPLTLADHSLTAELERLRQSLHDALRELSEQGNEIAGLQATIRTLGAQKLALTRELQKSRGERPEARDALDVLVDWARKTGHKRILTRLRNDDLLDGEKLDDDRGKAVLKALKTYSKQTLLLVNEGIALAPYVVYGKRRMAGAEQNRRDDLPYALRSDDRVQECVEIAQRASQAPSTALLAAWRRADAQASLCWERFWEAYQREGREMSRAGLLEVDGVMRGDGEAA